ncbi:MAG: MBOAT family protein [Lachnospiraceae bacterium]|nr:MBOAT family protein [Lachnospiraceae bacterium]
MYFTSYEFIGFLLITLILYYVVPKKAPKWPVLLIMSLLFYALNGVGALAFIIGTAAVMFFGALGLERLQEEQQDKIRENGELTKEEKKEIRKRYGFKKNLLITVCVAINVGALAFVKIGSLIAVLGISYYTLRAIGYLVDVNRKTVKAERNFFKFLLYISFFPVVIQGPLTDYGELTKSLYENHDLSWDNVGRGLLRVVWGFFKKLVIADRVFVAVSAIVENETSYRGVWVLAGMMLYTLELYADFTGGIDITIGMSEMLGIKVQENFDRPFFSTSLKEYWRRWHITMAAWFKTYLFYPVSVCPPMKKLLKFTRKHFGERVGKRIPVYLASAIVWFTTGLWHGFAANYVTWAMLHFAILMISEELEPAYASFHNKCKWASSRIYRVFMSLRTVFIVSLLMQFDIFKSVPLFFTRLVSLFGFGGQGLTAGFEAMGLALRDWIILGVGAVLMLAVSLLKGDGFFRDKLWNKPWILRYGAFAVLFTAILLLGMYGVGYDAGQFIYTRF